MTTIWLFAGPVLVLATCTLLLLREVVQLHARTRQLERRLENAKVSITTHCGPNPHNHKAVVSFPAPTGKTQ